MQTWISRDLAAYRGVVFDFDGTLVDLPVDWKGLRKALRRYWATVGVCPRIRSIREGLDIVESQAGRKALEGSWQIIRRYEAAAVANASIREMEVGALRACADRGQRIAVFSSNMSDTVEEALAFLDLTDAVDYVVGGDRVKHRKPHHEGLVRILERWRLAPPEAAYVADGSHERAIAGTAGTHFFPVCA